MRGRAHALVTTDPPQEAAEKSGSNISQLCMRLPQDFIEGIRKAYERDWGSSRVQERQMAVALYFIDKLALRAGHEKDEDEADTVGCCTLKARASGS